MKLNRKIAKRIHRWNQSICNLLAFVVSIRVSVGKRAEHPVPNDQTSAVVFVDAVRIPPVMNLMMLWNVQKVVEKVAESVDKLRVDPELVEQTHAVVHNEGLRRNSE